MHELAYKRLKTMENNKNVGLSVAVAYERWLFTRGFNYKDLIGKILVFLIGDYLWDMVT